MRVNIERLGMDGEGITKLIEGENAGKICFVPFALPGENVDIDVVQSKKRFCNAKLLNIANKSEHRINPKCKYFGVCGGCQLQHMDKQLQIEYKTSYIKSLMQKSTNCDIEISKFMNMDDFSYRNKMVFPIGQDDGHAIIGMFENKSHNVVKIDKCLIANDLINQFLNIVQEYLKESSIKGYDFKTNKGDWKYIVVRTNGNNLLVTVVVSQKCNLRVFYKYLSSYFDNIGLSIVVSDKSQEIMSGKYCYLYGLEYLNLEENGIKYSINNCGFLQVNDKVKNTLYSSVVAKIDKSDTVIDAYSGAGLLSSIISKKSKEVVGIEINQSASNSAIKLAKENNISNIKFITGDVVDYISSCLLDDNKNYTIVLDPPRAGCDGKVLNAIVSSSENVKINKIIYISCNPATLVRDLNILKEKFNIVSVELFDMFPQTKHVETLVELERKQLENDFKTIKNKSIIRELL